MDLPLDRFENVAQVGGIWTATLDNGPGRGSRVALVQTGGGLRYTVALDRGMDIVDAFFNRHALAYLTLNGIKPPSHAYHRGEEWLAGWPAGLVTTCGPTHIGMAPDHSGSPRSLHGNYSSQPAEIEMLVNPRPQTNRDEMLISGVIRDSRAYGPNTEVRRTIQSALMSNDITLFDQTTNLDPYTRDHGLMYHVNFGWPLLDDGSRLVMAGHIQPWPDQMQNAPLPDKPEGYKHVPPPSEAFTTASRGFICTPATDPDGDAHVGLVNDRLGLAVELVFAVRQIPRVMVWQHYAAGMYVCGVEPLVGTPFGRQAEPDHHVQLAPGQMRASELMIRVHDNAEAIEAFAAHDGELSL